MSVGVRARRALVSTISTAAVAAVLLIAPAPATAATGSAPAAAITAAAPSAPIAKSAALRKLKVGSVTILGTPATGKKLTAKVGAWTSGTKLKYQWYVAGKAVPKATGSTYIVRPSDVDRSIKVKVTGTKSGYATKSVTSAGTKKVVGKVYASCAAMNKDYPSGIRTLKTKGDMKGGVLKPFKGTPFASDVLYAKQSIARDRDRDGIMCER